jgi:copper(I)-binding protein
MKTALFFSATLLASSLSAAAEGIRVEQAASHAMVPGAKVGDGYFDIVNDGAEPDRLVSARSPRAASVQLHKMDMANGVMTMRAVKDGLSVPPHATIKLAPGYHLMFNGVSEPFRQGEQVPATLTFERAGAITVSFAVGRVAGPLDDAQQQAQTATMSGMDMSAVDHQTQQAQDPVDAIGQVLKTMFETPDKPLEISPVVVASGWAVAGWRQEGRGGRVLLQRTEHGWQVHAIGGDPFKTAAGLEAAGVPAEEANSLTASIASAEAALAPDVVKLLGSFAGTVMLADGSSKSGHGEHTGH